MSLLDQIRKDVKHILNNGNDFAIPIIFSNPDLTFEVEVMGTAKKHHTALDEIGNVINSRQASVTIHESDLAKYAYPVRNVQGEVAMRNHKCRWADAMGNTWVYEVDEWFPDEHLGIIVILLKNAKYEPKNPT